MRKLAKIYKIKFRRIEFEKHKIISIQKEILKIVEDNPYLENEEKM